MTITGAMTVNSAMRFTCCKYCCLAAFFGAVLPGSLAAEQAALHAGMHYGDVLGLKGPALFKQEEESRRRDIWSYPGDRLVFQNGRLKDWKGAVPGNRSLKSTSSKAVLPVAGTETGESQPKVSGRNLPRNVPLSEILRDVPSSEEEEHTPSRSGVPMPPGPRGIMSLEGGRPPLKD